MLLGKIRATLKRKSFVVVSFPGVIRKTSNLIVTSIFHFNFSFKTLGMKDSCSKNRKIDL